MVYQVSYVVKNSKRKGHQNLDLVNGDHYPAIGEIVTIKGKRYKVLEVTDLIPPRAQFCYVHALVEQM